MSKDTAYEVLARKWRPRQFEDVVGQEHVTRTLRNAMASSRIAHAYLFVGSRGIGKTSIARIFAKVLNCPDSKDGVSCDKCDSCREIAAGNSLDVLEIDGASNNGVDQVRDLRDTVMFAPSRGPYRIYIIDEVHMLSTPAFNALLKTLEEPPSHVKFFFATTEPERILPTIISRCQRFDLRRIPAPLIVERLAEVAKAEKVKIEDDALLAVARGAEGGMRDAESALDQLIAFRGTEITEEDVLGVFGLVSRARLEALAEAVLRGDVAALIRIIGDLDEAGKDLQRVVVELMEHFRNLLVCMHVEEPGEELDLTDAQIETLKGQADLTDTARVLRIASTLGECAERMRHALSRRTLLETALIRCARAAHVVSIEELLRLVQGMREAGPAAAAEQVHVEARRPSPGLVAERPTDYETKSARSSDEELELLRTQWRDIVKQASRLSLRAGRAMSDGRVAAVSAEGVQIEIDAEFPEQAAALEVARERKICARALSKALGRDVAVEIRVGTGSPDAEPQPDSPAPADTSVEDVPVVTDSEPGPEAGTGRRDRAEWIKEPAVQKALEFFNGQILDIRD